MYRKTTRENQNRPLYKCCDYCGRNDHKVAVRLSAEVRLAGKTRQGLLPHPVVGYCTSCYERHVARATERGESWPVPGSVVYDTRGPASVKKHPVVKVATPTEETPNPSPVLPPAELHAVFATTPDHKTYRVSDPAGWGTTQNEWMRLDDLRREGRLPHVKFFEVRSVELGPDRPLVGPEVRSHDRYDNAPVDMNFTRPVLAGSKGHSDVKDAAHKAWMVFTGGVYTKRYRGFDGELRDFQGTQGEGGWFYWPNGTTVSQGKHDLARVAKQRRMVVQGADSRWYVFCPDSDDVLSKAAA